MAHIHVRILETEQGVVYREDKKGLIIKDLAGRYTCIGFTLSHDDMNIRPLTDEMIEYCREINMAYKSVATEESAN